MTNYKSIFIYVPEEAEGDDSNWWGIYVPEAEDDNKNSSSNDKN